MRKKYVVSRGCTLCGACASVCPSGAISLTSDGAVIDQEKCVRCGACYDNCASEAIEELVEEENRETGRKDE